MINVGVELLVEFALSAMELPSYQSACAYLSWNLSPSSIDLEMEGSNASVENISHSEAELVHYSASLLRLCPVQIVLHLTLVDLRDKEELGIVGGIL
jgi:hypothetical protein